MRISFVHRSILASIKSFNNQYVDKEMYLAYGLILLLMIIGFIYIGINALTARYVGFNYIPWRWIFLSPFILGVTLLAITARKNTPKLAKFTYSYGTFFFLALSFAVMTTGVQLTPFPTIDSFLAKLDQAMGVDTPALMAWTAQHVYIHKILLTVYNFLYVEIVAIPLILPFFKNSKSVNTFFMTMLIAFLIGTTIYYFFPTAAPASVFKSPYFMPSEHATYIKFYKVHHGQEVTSGDGGLIAFPSFHVAWAVILTYATYSKKWLFVLLLIINFLLIISTVLLGFHYLIDVFGGIILAGLAIFIAHLIHLKYFERGCHSQG